MGVFVTVVVICWCRMVRAILFTYLKKRFLLFVPLVLCEFLEKVVMKLGKGL